MIIIESVLPWILYFTFYSFLGWLIEVGSIFIQEGKLTNRGFLTGPFVVLFGFGACLIILLSEFASRDVLTMFLSGIFFLSSLEYLTGYFMEKIFGARWWDYSNRKFNINGRVALFPSLVWGVLSVFLVYAIHPFVERISVFMLASRFGVAICVFILLYFISDFIVSFNLASKLKVNIYSAVEELRNRGAVVSLIGKTKSEKNLVIKKMFKKLPLLQRKIVFAHPQFVEDIIAKIVNKNSQNK